MQSRIPLGPGKFHVVVLVLDEMCRLYGKFASYLRRVLCKTRLIFPRINGPIVSNGYNIVPTLHRCIALKIVVANRPV